MKISKEVKVGVVSILAIALLVWGYNYLKGTNLFVKSTSVYAIYPKVPGLAVSSPIFINGVQSGVVEDIYFHPDKSSRVIVKLRITEEGLFMPENSVADLISVDFLGSKAIGLYLGNSKIELKAGDTLISHYEKSMLADVTEQILPIKEKAENLMSSMDSAVIHLITTLNNFNDILSYRNKKNLTLTLENLQKAVGNFDLVAKNINSTLTTSIKPTMEVYKSLGDSLIALDLNTTIGKLETTMDNISVIMEKMDRGEGTMGQLINNDTLYHNLTGSTKELEELLRDIKLHPKRYFRVLSRKEIPYSP